MNKYDIDTCIEQIRVKERRLDRDRSISRRTPMVVRRQVEVEKSEQNETETITLSHYKNDSGFYAIPNENGDY